MLERGDDHPGAALGYYTAQGETPLVWGGGGSTRLRTQGHVTPEQYDAVFGPGGARDPATGARLVSTKRPGLELVVAAHKSVAELGVIGRVDDMHLILDAETAGTINYLDHVTRDLGGRRGRAATRTPTKGMLYAITRHATSRAGDPNPHDHILIANVVEMLDERGGFKAADTALWREHLHAATAYGRVCSARMAIELGYGVVADPGRSGRLGHWAIAGVPDEAMAIHSKRSQQIDSVVGGPDGGSYRQRAIAARSTRTAKRHQPVEDLVDRWCDELSAHGIHPSTLEAGITARRGSRITTDIDDLALDRLAGQLLERDGRLAAEKVFTRRDVIVAAAPHLFGLEPAVLDRLVDKVLGHANAIELESAARTGEAVFAPRCVIDTEREIAARALDRHRLGTAPALTAAAVDLALERTEFEIGHRLTESQRRTIVGVCSSSRSLDVVIGIAGAGKTTALRAVGHAFQADGHRIIAAATSGQAARTVGHDAGIESYTVASLLARLERGIITLDQRCVVVLDEAGMTDDHDIAALLAWTTTSGAKVVLVGDDRQLSAVGPGGGLRALAERVGGNVWELNDNIRQPDISEREALAELRSGDVEMAVNWFARNDRVVTAADRHELYGAVIDGWLADTDRGLDTVMLAWKRTTVDGLNQLARTAAAERRWLTGPEVTAPGGTRYRAGDRVVALAPVGQHVPTSETGTVRQIEPDTGAVIVDFDNGHAYRIARHDTGADRFAHAYAITVHRAQGATVDTAHTLEDGGGRELAYVGLSRARRHSTLYIEADDLDQAIEDLTGNWAIERRQQWVADSHSPLATRSSSMPSTQERRGPTDERPSADLSIDMW
ncbi:MAG: AAA family ATPase [Acidimicrobiales bacterium]|nr:AAA family ATPase [Acidimicrobiales bacterium]